MQPAESAPGGEVLQPAHRRLAGRAPQGLGELLDVRAVDGSLREPGSAAQSAAYEWNRRPCVSFRRSNFDGSVLGCIDENDRAFQTPDFVHLL